jgi:hypothetical protein
VLPLLYLKPPKEPHMRQGNNIKSDEEKIEVSIRGMSRDHWRQLRGLAVHYGVTIGTLISRLVEEHIEHIENLGNGKKSTGSDKPDKKSRGKKF